MEAATLLRRARAEAGISQAELASRLGKSQATVAALERRGANPTVETLDRVLRALGRKLELAAPEHRSSVDETLVASNLRMTPAERLEAFQSAHRSVQRLRGAAQRGGSGA